MGLRTPYAFLVSSSNSLEGRDNDWHFASLLDARQFVTSEVQALILPLLQLLQVILTHNVES